MQCNYAPYAVAATTTKLKMNQFGQFMHLPGFKFSPTDEELVDHYLKRKMLGQDHRISEIAEVNIYDFKPEELPGESTIKSNTLEWYFFVPRIYKYRKSQRSKRTTESGYWKATGVPRKVMKGKEVIATKKTLVFYTGRPPNGVRTSWVIHEYDSVPEQQSGYVVCKLMTGAGDVQTLEKDGSPTTVQLSSDVGDGQSSSHGTAGTSNSNGGGGRTGFSNYVPSPPEDDELQAHLNSFKSYNEMDYNINYVMSNKYM